MTDHFDYENNFDNLMEGFQVISFDWRYLYVNKSVVTQSKYSSKEDLLGFTMMEKYPGIENTELFKVMQQCMQERISKNTENEFTFPDNSKGCFELKIEPVPQGIFILSLDISERKKHALEKEKHILGLQKMITMTSHRVRQPIANILGASNLLDNEDLPAGELNRIVSYMKESALNLDAFTKELTTFIHEQKLNIK